MKKVTGQHIQKVVGIFLGFLLLTTTIATEETAYSTLVYPGQDGRLVYKPYTPNGDQILDFSHCGYQRSEQPIPDVPVVITLKPLPGKPTPNGTMAYPKGPDNHAQIQNALDKVAAQKPDKNGFRGAVLLTKGTYYLYASLQIRSGVVLRGEGDGANGTVLIFSDTKRHAIYVGNPKAKIEMRQPKSPITDAYVPAGSVSVTVEDASPFKPGDTIHIRKTTNDKWIKDLGMDHFYGMKKEQDKPWRAEQFHIRHHRQITQITGNKITFDVPIPQSISTEYGGGYVQADDVSQMDTQIGLEYVRVVSNYDTSVKKDGNYVDEENNFNDAILVSCINGWVRNCTAMHMRHAAVMVDNGSQYCTVRDCKSLAPVSQIRGGRRYSFSIDDSSMILFYNCDAEEGRHDFVLGSRTPGPNAFVMCRAKNATSISEPHHKWSTGVLYDNISLKNGGALAAINRGSSGSGHGWAGVNVVFWNSDAASVVAFDPPTPEQNFAIGYTGKKQDAYPTNTLNYANTRAGYRNTPKEVPYKGVPLMGDGHIEHPQQPVTPASLFIQQLTDRIGKTRAQQVLKQPPTAVVSPAPSQNQTGTRKGEIMPNQVEQPSENQKILFEDKMTENWQANWFLDGQQATLKHSDAGLHFSAGNVTRMDDPEAYHAHHAVLWTKQTFEGNIRITYDITRVDTSNYGTIMVYIQAQGIGTAPYEKDIYAWKELRNVPKMSTYFDYMNLLHISYISRIRCRRYPRDISKDISFADLIIKPDYNDPGDSMIPGKRYRIEIEKRTSTLIFKMYDSETGELLQNCKWDTSKNPEQQQPRLIEKGRIGLRQMSTKKFIYQNFKVHQLSAD